VAVSAGLHAQTRTQSKQPAAPTSDAPQRTILTTPPAVHSDSDAAPIAAAPDSSDTALEKYREMWRKMSAAQQKAFLDSGGYTPEQYERMLKPRGSASGSGGFADPQRKIDPGMDALNKSLQNLDTIRDANIGRVQTQSCPPEVASRIADLKTKLQSYEPDANGPSRSSTTRTTSAPVDPIVIATDWYKPSAPYSVDRASQQARLIDDVLPQQGAPAPKPPVNEQEIARIKTELEQLSGACGAPVR
jgi:hypothetical protein